MLKVQGIIVIKNEFVIKKKKKGNPHQTYWVCWVSLQTTACIFRARKQGVLGVMESAQQPNDVAKNQTMHPNFTQDILFSILSILPRPYCHFFSDLQKCSILGPSWFSKTEENDHFFDLDDRGCDVVSIHFHSNPGHVSCKRYCCSGDWIEFSLLFSF